MLPAFAILAQQSAEPNITGAALFYLFALVAAISAIGVVMSRNIVRTAVALLFTLIGVAGLYFLLNAEFLAAVQLVIYVGGTLILIVFGVMLTSKSPFSHFEPKRLEVIVAISLGMVLLIALTTAMMRASFHQQMITGAGAYPMDKLGQALLGDFIVPFELASVLLLVVMIGAAYLAKARRRDDEMDADRKLAEQARRQS